MSVRSFLAALLVLALALPCRAELFPFREHARQIDSKSVALGIDTTTFFGRAGAPHYALVAPTLGASLRLGEAVFEGALPLTYVRERQAGTETLNDLAVGNPWFGLAYLPDCSCGLSRLSLGMAPDLATDSAPLDRTALTLSRRAQGSWDGYLWMPGLMPVVAGASTLMQRGVLHLVWDGDVVIGLPGHGRDTELGVQSAGDAGLYFRSGFVFGGRVHGVWYPTFDAERFQAAASAYMRLKLGGSTVGLRYVANLNGPAGLGSRDDRVWGLSLFIATAL